MWNPSKFPDTSTRKFPGIASDSTKTFPASFSGWGEVYRPLVESLKPVHTCMLKTEIVSW
jgi:hypothetical protein